MFSVGLPVCRQCHASISKQRLFKPRQIQSRILRRTIHSERFSPFVPPSPASLGKPVPAKTYPRLRKWTRRLVYVSISTGVLYVLDTRYNAASITRTLRTFTIGLIAATDYKINFRPNPPLADSIPALHARNAQRLFDLLRANGGLYLKIGQAIAMQSAVLPPEFQKMFARMFDDAPQNDWKEVERVIREDFGKSVEEVFGVGFGPEQEVGKGLMERTARASASVAQVHWARLADGREVAVKIQKSEIKKQVGWDLWAFKVVMYLYTTLFDLPMYSLVPYITERLLLETDFVNEADNSETMARLVANEPRLKDRVYIPKVYRELSSKRVMTAEWIEGVRLWDKEAMTRPWRGGRRGSPGAHGAALPPPTDANFSTQPVKPGQLKPDREISWRGPRNNGGLGLSLAAVMTTMVDLFSAQMFLWGSVHCDPHPGNIFVRRLPSGKPELVLIDHGLYIHLSPHFRHTYARFWKALLTFDNKTLADISKEWGVGNPDFFASATLMRPYTGGDKSSTELFLGPPGGAAGGDKAFEMQERMREAIRQLLADEKLWPRELLFLGRNLRIVQGNNQFLGSPVNRLKITATWASRALVESPDLPWREKLGNWGRHIIFRVVLVGSDVFWWISRVRQWFGLGGGMEDEIEERMRGMAKEWGVELQHSIFQG